MIDVEDGQSIQDVFPCPSMPTGAGGVPIYWLGDRWGIRMRAGVYVIIFYCPFCGQRLPSLGIPRASA